MEANRMRGKRIRWKPQYEALVEAHKHDAWYFGGVFVLATFFGVALTMLSGKISGCW